MLCPLCFSSDLHLRQQRARQNKANKVSLSGCAGTIAILAEQIQWVFCVDSTHSTKQVKVTHRPCWKFLVCFKEATVGCFALFAEELLALLAVDHSTHA